MKHGDFFMDLSNKHGDLVGYNTWLDTITNT